MHGPDGVRRTAARALAVVVFASAMSSCRDPGPLMAEGTYALQSAAGKPLPYFVFGTPSVGWYYITAETLVLQPDGTATLATQWRYEKADTQQREWSEARAGGWVRRGSQVLLRMHGDSPSPRDSVDASLLPAASGGAELRYSSASAEEFVYVRTPR